jgi:rod shape-determining protein MreC
VKRLEIDTRRGAGRPLVLAVLVVAALIITTVWYREGDDGALHAARRVVVAVSQPFETAGTWIATPFRGFGNWVSGLSVNSADYAALKDQNQQLKERLAALEEAKLENDRIRALVDFAKAQDVPTIGARIIGRPTDSRQRSIVIDRGTSSGVQKGDTVVAAGGLVGQVVEVTPFDAQVRLITDSSSGVAVLVQRTRANGIVRGALESPLELDFVEARLAPVVGDVLITSGLGGTYPKGIVVGEVTAVSTPQAGLYAAVTVASRVDIDRIEEVLVMTSQTATSTSLSGGGE